MNIAFIAVKGIPISGGIEKYTEHLASHLADMSHNVTVYTSSNYGNIDGKYNNFEIITIKVPKSKFFEKLFLIKRATKDAIKRNFDIIHFHSLTANLYFGFRKKFFRKRIPFIVQMHGIEHQRAKWGFAGKSYLLFAEKKSIKKTPVVTVVSQELKNYFDAKYSINARFIPTGVEIPNLEKLDCDDSILDSFSLKKDCYYLFMARLVKEKGCHYLIDAFSQARTDKKLVIAGKFDQNDSYHKELLKKASSNPNIVFVGEVLNKKKNSLLKHCYSFCLPSEIEGMSVALLEAMSFKKACIVSDIPENKYISEGHSFLFKNKDVTDLKNVIEKVDSLSKNELDAVGNLAYEYVQKNNSYDAISKAMLELYKEAQIAVKNSNNHHEQALK